jgi:hypothetical protein
MNDSLPILGVQSSSYSHSSIIILIVILSILSFFGVIFMIFGPMMRSEAMKRIDNYIFGRNSQPQNGVEYYDD